MRMNNGDEFEEKRNQFRQEIRRKQIEQIFSTKRRYHNQAQQTVELSLDSLVSKLKMNKMEPIITLTNFISDDAPFENYLGEYGPQPLNNLCRDLVYSVVNCILPTLSSPHNSQNRQTCLRLLSNVFADRLTPHTQLLQILVPGLFSIYGSIRECGNFNEVLEFGWLVANILVQLSLERQVHERNLEILLKWAEQLFEIQLQDVVVFLYRSLTQFFKRVDRVFKQEGQNYVEHFKVYRMILLQTTIEQNLDAKIGTSLQHVLKFINNNITYVKFVDERLIPKLLKKTMSLFSCYSETIIRELIKILKYLIKEHTEEVLVKIIHKHFHSLIQILQFQTIPIKIEVLEVIKLICRTKEVIQFLQGQKQLQEIMKILVLSIGDASILVQLAHLTWHILSVSDGKYGNKILGAFEEIYNQTNGEAAAVISQLVEWRKAE